MMIDSPRRREYLANIKSYLIELRTLTGKTVTKSQLGDPIDALTFRDTVASRGVDLNERFTLEFNQLVTERFKCYIRNLELEKSEGIYIWTNRSVICGLYLVDHLYDIDFSFSFNFADGIIGFSTKDLSNSSLLDFYEGSSSVQLVDVEVKGDSWPRITF